ncbi:MAG: transposase [Candidatus Marinimicrobia bacterium]|nr:transposase [Candidatus Neomarinimicrobiota bacterium]MCF7905234.1 transposase [Candidatus Neomarinimicrobiota bacterium]
MHRRVQSRGYQARAVSRRLGVSDKSMYYWMKQAKKSPTERAEQDLQAENATLRTELSRVEEERDILKKAAAYFAKESK